ncbi:MAG: hypothetical protein KZQ58_03520 [gamma proteobacterium symbiont of Bathyaustriella thionipta]|nr:hypothetical protein [gamma proteobacterium symbiont of Bathyaustriella thionipta]
MKLQLLITLAVILALIFINRGLKPLRALRASAELAVRQGHLQQVEEARGHPEILSAIRSFNHMVRVIKKEIRESEMARTALAAAKLQAEEHAQQMFREKEFSHITLECIADGVITTNEHGLLNYMNPLEGK